MNYALTLHRLTAVDGLAVELPVEAQVARVIAPTWASTVMYVGASYPHIEFCKAIADGACKSLKIRSINTPPALLFRHWL